MDFRELGAEERSRIDAFYQRTTYKRPVSSEDRIFVAEQDGEILGAVRIESKAGVQVLRGMYLLPERMREGIGTRLLNFIRPTLAATESYCIPFNHLFEFYWQVGFRAIAEADAPNFLNERLERYFDEGKRVAIMHRASGV